MPSFAKSVLAAAALTLTVLALPASADTFSIQYNKVPTGSPDFYNGNAPLGVSNNFVQSTLGPDGLPVFNPNFTAASGTVLAPSSTYLNAAGELLYWSPTNPNGGQVTADGAGTIALSANPVNMFAPGTGGTDASFQETAILTGFFNVPTNATDTVTFNVGADDLAFVYVDGNLVESLGGIHGNTSAPSSVMTYGAGTHQIQLFYADRDVTQASLSFTDSSNLTITPTSPTPEPSSLILLGTGLVTAVGAFRRKLLA